MIVLISSVFPPEPVVSATIVHDLALALSENRKVKIITPFPSRPMGFSFKKTPIENNKIEHLYLNSYVYPKSRLFGRMRESYSFGKYAASYIRKNRAEIECIFMHAWPIFGQYLIVRTAKKHSIPIITHIVDIYPEALSGKIVILNKLVFSILLRIDKYVLRNSSKVITISPNMKDYLMKTRNLIEQNIEVVYNWQNEEWFVQQRKSMKQKPESSVFTFMFLGNLSRTAAIHVLISAYKISGIANSRLVIVGNGSEKDHLIKLAGCSQHISIEFFDAPLLEVPKIQDQADVLLLSLKKGMSRFAFPSKLSAYMFSEKPIIACVEKDSDTANVIRIADCGWIVAPEDINELSKALKIAASAPRENLQKFGSNGFKYAYENFSKKPNLYRLFSIVNKSVVT